MVTDAERDYMWTEYAADKRARINLGIRRRLAPLVENSRRRIELLNALLLSMPGTPVIYYGDEIGMGDNVYLGDRNGVRTPMQWTSDRNAGFSSADAAALYAPVIVDPVYGYGAVNVEAQERIPGSLLHWMRRILGVRRQYPAFGRGSLSFLDPDNTRVLAYLRQHEGVTILCVANLSRFAQYVELDLRRVPGHGAGRDDRPRPLPAHRRAAIPAHLRSPRVLLVPADRWRRSRRLIAGPASWRRRSPPPGSRRSAGTAPRASGACGGRARSMRPDRWAVPGWLLVLRPPTRRARSARYLVPAIAGADGFREPRDGEGVWRRSRR